MRRLVINRPLRSFLTPIGCLVGLGLFCEFTVYYLVLLQCTWPGLDQTHLDNYVPVEGNRRPQRVLVVASPHIGKERKERWYDRQRTEWQMERSFKAALFIHNPDIVIIIGDLLHTPASNMRSMEKLTSRFRTIFRVDKPTKLFVVPGPNDLENIIIPTGNVQSPNGHIWSEAGLHLVLIKSVVSTQHNSRSAIDLSSWIRRVGHQLICSRGDDMSALADCVEDDNLDRLADPAGGVAPQSLLLHHLTYSRPILIQNLALSSSTSSPASDTDPSIKCGRQLLSSGAQLPQDKSTEILQQMQPRLVLSPSPLVHPCHLRHYLKSGEWVHEWAIPSFSWAVQDTPSFLLLKMTANDYSVNQCSGPSQSTQHFIYILGITLILIWFIKPQIIALLVCLRLKKMPT